MRMRRVKLLEQMFTDVASKEEIEQLNCLYKNGFKSSAIVLMLRRVKTKWDTVVKEPAITKPVFQGNATRQMIKITCLNCQEQAAYLQV